MKTIRFRRHAGTAAALTVAALAAAAPAAQADTRVGGLCSGQTFSRPFVAFGDTAWYTLAPKGDFEDGLRGVDTTGGAAVQNTNNTALGRSQGHSLALPPGSSVTTPPVCVTSDYPSMRLFARNDGGFGKLTVSVVYTGDLLGNKSEKVVGDIDAKDAKGAWMPSKVLPTLAGKLGYTMSIRLTPDQSSSAWSVDDLYVDPYTRG